MHLIFILGGRNYVSDKPQFEEKYIKTNQKRTKKNLMEREISLLSLKSIICTKTFFFLLNICEALGPRPFLSLSIALFALFCVYFPNPIKTKQREEKTHFFSNPFY